MVRYHLLNLLRSLLKLRAALGVYSYVQFVCGVSYDFYR